LPENVRVFPRGQTAEVVHLRDDAPLARLVGISRDAQRPIRPAEFTPDPAGSFSIAVAHGEADAGALQARRMDYWALGGRHDRAALFTAPQVAHYPGSPQGRCPQEAGAHGCTLVQVDEQGHARTTPLPTDVLRWLTELVPLDESSTRSSLEGLLRQRVQNLLETAPKVDLMISWAVSGSGPLIADLRRGSLAAELLAGLRNEYGGGRPAAWSVSLEAEPPAALPHSWYEQETFLGDFLRAVRQLEMNPSESLELDSYVSEAHQAGSLGSALAVAGPAARGRVLRQAAWLGVDLLGGEQLQQEQRP
jgi:DNA repair exonuclease SbcCD nuclease subunit